MVVFKNSLLSSKSFGLLEAYECCGTTLSDIKEGENSFLPFAPSVYDNHCNIGDIISVTGLPHNVSGTTVHTAFGYTFAAPSCTELETSEHNVLSLGQIKVGDDILLSGNAYDSLSFVPLLIDNSSTEYVTEGVAQLFSLALLYYTPKDGGTASNIKIVGDFSIDANLFQFLSGIDATFLEGTNNVSLIHINDVRWCAAITFFITSLRKLYLVLNKSPKSVVAGFLVHVIEFSFKTGVCPYKLAPLIQQILLTKFGIIVKLDRGSNLTPKLDFLVSLPEILNLIKLGVDERRSIKDLNPSIASSMFEYKKDLFYLLKDKVVSVDTFVDRGYDLVLEPNLTHSSICGLF